MLHRPALTKIEIEVNMNSDENVVFVQ
jgi:hypothetical protein